MAANFSLSDEVLLRIQFKFILLQVLAKIFLFINFLLIITFFKKECFYTTARYILFAVTLVSDMFLLVFSDVLLIFTYLFLNIQVWICILINAVVLVCVTLTPVTLAAMTLERYVAICMPLHHGELCSTRNTVHCVLIIHGISSVPCIVIISTLFATAPSNFYKQDHICHVDVFMFYKWQQHLRSAIYQSQFLIMSITIVFSYTKIMKVAKAASGEDKKSSKKGLRTVTLHGFQLLLCLIQLWCPFIEDAVFLIDDYLFNTIRYFNYIIFYLAPRCLSPLIYGVRDEAFCKALKHSVSFGMIKRKDRFNS